MPNDRGQQADRSSGWRVFATARERVMRPHLRRIPITWGLVLLALAACTPRPSQTVTLGALLEQVDFSRGSQWEQYSSEAQRVNFRIEDGAYRAEAWDGGFIWALNPHEHTDVLIQVDTQQLSEYANNAYGVMCRAAPTNNGTGYYFFISGDGSFTIRRGAADEVHPLIPWTTSAAIQRGQAFNRLRAACVGDYLALWVNDQFVAETRDDYFRRGAAGISAGVPEGGAVDVTFDDLRIWQAALADTP